MNLALSPRSLFGRTALLLLLVLGIRELGSYVLFHYYSDSAQMQRMTGQLASQAALVSDALKNLEGDERLTLAKRLSKGRHFRLETSLKKPPGQRYASPFLGNFAAQLEERLGYATEVRDDEEGLWLRVRSGEEEYWLLSPLAPHDSGFGWQWLLPAMSMGVLALGGAFLVVWRVNGPLRQLAETAAAVGQGRKPAPTIEEGPIELRALSSAINRMTTDLQQMERDRALLLAGVSHDLRTPLARLRLGVELETPDGEFKEGMIQDIEEMNTLLDQFLAFAQDEGEEAVVEGADLNGIVANTCVRYRQRVTFTGGALPPMPLRPLAVQRLVGNLVNNALRYGRESLVEVVTDREGEKAVLKVLDRGPGIPAAERERALRSFTRLEKARSDAGHAGLGLAIVNRIVLLHNGAIELRDREGGGLEVRIQLPT